MEEKDLKKYGMPIGERFKKMTKKLATIGLSTVMLFSATFGIAACSFGISANTNPGHSTTQPGDPDEPKKPENPVDPENPENPDNPTTPENPDQPEKPVEPENPENPTDPDDPDKQDPEQPDTPPAEEKFELNAKTFEAIVENITPMVKDMIALVAGWNWQIEQLYDFYLTKSAGSNIVDTIGAAFSMNATNRGNYFSWMELTIPTTEDLTLENLSKATPTYSIKKAKSISKYSFNVSREIEAQFSEAAELIEKQSFENYATAEWIGWYGENGLVRNVNKAMCYENGHIKEVLCYVYHNHFQYEFTESIRENFVGKEPSDSTYDLYVEEYDLPENAINIRSMRRSFEQENQN